MKCPFYLNLGLALGCFGAISAASILQAAWFLQPCTMCILQRYAFLIVGLMALSQLALPQGRWASMMRCMSYLAALVGLCASVRIQWAISVPSNTCGRDKFAAFLNGLPWVDSAPAMFEATGVCGDPVPPVLGVPFHVWSFVLFAAIVLVQLALRSRRTAA